MLQEEEKKIRERYARRDVKKHLYTWDQPDEFLRLMELQNTLSRMLRRLQHLDLSSLEILDVGCGTGFWLRRMMEWGAEPHRLHGVDLLPDRIERARGLSCPELDLRVATAWPLPFDSQSMDMVCTFTVFSSILDPAGRRELAKEMQRVVRPGGLILIYDFWVSHPGNPDTVGVRLGEIKKYFQGMPLTSKLVTLAVPLSRPLSKLSPWLCYTVSRAAPFLRTHRLSIFVKK